MLPCGPQEEVSEFPRPATEGKWGRTFHAEESQSRWKVSWNFAGQVRKCAHKNAIIKRRQWLWFTCSFHPHVKVKNDRQWLLTGLQMICIMLLYIYFQNASCSVVPAAFSEPSSLFYIGLGFNKCSSTLRENARSIKRWHSSSNPECSTSKLNVNLHPQHIALHLYVESEKMVCTKNMFSFTTTEA